MSVSWLLFKKTGRQSIGRLSLTVAAIGLGTVILLSFLSGINGLMERVDRMGWQRFSAVESRYVTPEVSQAQKPINGVKPLQMTGLPGAIGNTAQWRDQNISQTILHATGENSPELPGLKTPKSGEYYLSPALEKIVREHPKEKIGERFGTTYLGVIPSQYVSSPDSLEVIRGAYAEEVAAWQKSQDSGRPVVASLYDTQSVATRNTASFDPMSVIVFSFGGTILLFPIVMFVAVATQLGSTQREQRYAALRLIGATRAQVTEPYLLESFVATVVGILIGTLVYLVCQGGLQAFQFGGQSFWREDMTVSLTQYIIFVSLTIGLSLFASWRAMRKVRTSPLGVTRRERLNKKVRFWRVLPLTIGIAIFAWIALPNGKKWVTDNATDILPMLLVLGGVMLVMFGLLLAGPWLTSRLSRLFAHRTKNATILLASRRISGHSRTIFRSVSGLVLALFAGSFYLATVSGVDNLNIQSINDNGYSQLKSATALVLSESLPSDFTETLKKQPFTRSATAIRIGSDQSSTSYIPCDQLATYTKHHCPATAAADDVVAMQFTAPVVKTVSTMKASKVPQNTQTGYLVSLNDSQDIDKLRSLVLQNSSKIGEVYVADGTRAQRPVINPVIADLAALTYVGIGITLFVAVASLIVSTIGGLLERRKSLFTLRLGGMTLSQMKRMVLVESLIPLISTSVLAASAGIWVANVFLNTFSSTVRLSLSPLYFIIVIGSLLAGAIGIWLVLPMLRTITSLEQNQTE